MKTLFSSYIGAFIILAVLASASWANELHRGYSIPLTVGTIAVFLAWSIERKIKWFVPRSILAAGFMCLGIAGFGISAKFEIPWIEGTWGIPPWLAGCFLAAGLILFILAHFSYRFIKESELEERRQAAFEAQAQSGYGTQIGAAAGALMGSLFGPIGTATGAAIGAGVGSWFSGPATKEDESGIPTQTWWNRWFGGSKSPKNNDESKGSDSRKVG